MPRFIGFKITDRAYDRMQLMDISPQKLANYLLDSWLNEHEDDYGRLFKILHIEQKIAELDQEIIHLESKKHLRTLLQKELEVEKECYNDTKRYVELHHLTKYLNRRIIKYKYNRKEIEERHQDIIERILEIDPNFKLDDQILMVRKLREEFYV